MYCLSEYMGRAHGSLRNADLPNVDTSLYKPSPPKKKKITFINIITYPYPIGKVFKVHSGRYKVF